MNAVLSPIRADFNDPLEEAVHAYIQAKRTEDAATKTRLQAEERILALTPAKEEGSQTIEVGGYKLTTTGSLNYKCEDIEALLSLARASNVPENLIPVKTKVDLDSTGAKWIRSNEPDIWRLMSKCITVKPAKTSVKVAV